jgi:hypothetical protein
MLESSLTLDSTGFLLFGKPMSALSSHEFAGQESEFANAFNLARAYLPVRGRLGHFYWLANGKAFRDACKTCHRFVDEAVRNALEGSDLSTGAEKKNSNYIFINALIQETRDPKVLRDQCLNLLLAGRDTTAYCLSWTL